MVLFLQEIQASLSDIQSELIERNVAVEKYSSENEELLGQVQKALEEKAAIMDDHEKQNIEVKESHEEAVKDLNVQLEITNAQRLASQVLVKPLHLYYYTFP